MALAAAPVFIFAVKRNYSAADAPVMVIVFPSREELHQVR
jgi:hypothetical protein